MKGNFPRVHAALSELDSFARQLISDHRGHTRSSLLDGIQEALTQFNRLSLSLKQVHTLVTPQLKINNVTSTLFSDLRLI